MVETEKLSDNKKAMTIGMLSIFSYIINYVLRMLLSVLTPTLLETGKFTVELIALVSSI